MEARQPAHFPRDTLFLPNEKLYDIAIGIADVHLQNAITARTRAANYLNIVSLQVLACLLQVGDLEGDVRSITNRKFIRAIPPRVHLGNTSRFSFADQVYLSVLFTEPGTGEGKIARSGNFFHSKYLAIKTA